MSFMLESLIGNKWSPDTFSLRFATEKEAREYGQHLNQRFNIAEPIRVQPSTDAVNCTFTGDLGQKYLKRI
jgi:hypothetical protein